MRSVEREIEGSKSKLAPIVNTLGGQLGLLHFGNGFRRNLFRWVGVIGCKSIEHFLVPDPVLQHLRRGFDEIAGHVRAGEADVFRASDNGVEGVTELMEE